MEEMATGIAKLQKVGVKVSGFRAPFLRFNEATLRAVAANDLLWSSNSVMHSIAAGCGELLGCGSSVRTLETFYTYRSSSEEPALPYWGPFCLEIPILVPDDEMLVDRLGIRDGSEIADIWLRMLAVSQQQGELFTLLVHPERMDFVAGAMERLLKAARDAGKVWVASLDEIGRWWQERARTSIDVSDTGNGTFRVMVKGPDSLSVSIHNPGGTSDFVAPGKDGSLLLHSRFRPVIQYGPGVGDNVKACLMNEGFLLEPETGRSQCSFSLNGHTPDNHRLLLESLKQARGPLVRLWRWPNRFGSALAITADVDAITLWDFVRRARHFQRLSVCHLNPGSAGNAPTS
jgi:hypothetical protein